MSIRSASGPEAPACASSTYSLARDAGGHVSGGGCVRVEPAIASATAADDDRIEDPEPIAIDGDAEPVPGQLRGSHA
jgi:hypothetical protein